MGQRKKQKGKEKKQAKNELRETLLKANAIHDIMEYFVPFRNYSPEWSIRACWLEDLTDSAQTRMFELFETNMKNLYTTSSWGYNPIDKKVELFHSDSRYLVVFNESSTGTDIGAFVHYRFLEDETRPVLYVYEIQVDLSIQRSGLGKRLMQMLELIARHCQMQALMLTVFTCNQKAVDFYTKKLKFSIDENSPENSSYLILSKKLIY